MVPYAGLAASMGPLNYAAAQGQFVAQPPPSQQALQVSVAEGGNQGQGGQGNASRGQGGRGGGGRGRGGNGGGRAGGWNGQGGQNPSGRGGQEGGQGYGRPRFDWGNATCWHCSEVGHTIRFCQRWRDDELAGLISSCMDGDIYDKWGEHIDPRTPGGIRQEALRLAAAGPSATPTMFRMWQAKGKLVIKVEEIVGDSEKGTQRLKPGTIREKPIVVESDDEGQEADGEPATLLLGRMEDLLERVGRFRRKLQALCEEAREWEANLPEVFLYDSGPEPSPGQQGCPRVATVGTGPRSGRTYRPPTSHGRVSQAARTRSQNKAGPSQEPSQAPPRKEPEPGRRKEVVEFSEEEEDDDEEDERLRQEEDQRAELRAKKRGAQEEAEPSLLDSVPKRNKYAVRMEEGFDVERMVDKLLEGHNNLMNLKDILASAPRLRGFGEPSDGGGGVSVSASGREGRPCDGPGPSDKWAFFRGGLKQGSQRRYKTIDKKCPVPVLVTEDEKAYYERERGLIRRMREHALDGPCRINDENEGKVIIGEPDFLSPHERALMVGLMKKRHRAYAFNDDERGRLDVDKIPMIRIHTVPHEPWNLRGARYPNPDEEKMVVDYLDGKMRTHVADYFSGPYASPWFCFIKPNRTLRWVQDLQWLNAVTVRDAGGLPNADALSESCAGRPIISLIDLYSGYDQFPLYPPDRPVTAMHTPRGLIHMNVAPQGLMNAVAMVQRHMIRAMQTVSPHITQPYIDNLAVKGPKENEEDEVMPGVRHFVWKHVQDIDQVLRLLEEHNLTVSGPKSKHCMRETTILGFFCNESGRRPDVRKTDKILEWPVPFRSITDVKSFLGTSGFRRSFVKDFATKTEHLRKLVRQDQEWVWGEDQEEAVGRMKGEFKEGGLVLGAPNYEVTEERPFVIETDAGPSALGGVLIQADTEGKERPLRFESRSLNTTERNYSQFKKETLAVLHCLRTFRNYVFGRRLILRVDPPALACSLKNYTPSDPTVARWLTYIWMFNFELERIPGNKNRPNGLSRINWDGSDEESIEDMPPVDGFLDQEEDVRLHIKEWSLRVPSCVSHPIWLAPKGYKQKEELVLKPFQEEDPWGSKDVGWMMKLALAGTHSLVEEVRTIEEGPTQVEEYVQLMGGMYLLTNTLLQGDFDRKGLFSHEENEILVPESRDNEFEEGEIKEAFWAEEYDGIYRELGLFLSFEMRDRDASAKTQKMRHLHVVRDDHLFIKRQVGNPRRIVCGRNRQIDIIAALHDGIAEGHSGVSATCVKISKLYHWDWILTMVIKYCQSCMPCQESSVQRPGEPLHPRLEKEVSAVVHLDLLFMPAGENGCNYIFDARDNLTGFVDGRAIWTKTDPVLANCIEEYFLRYPFVREFVMDRGSEFTCNEVRKLLAEYGVVANYTTAAHPQANAPTERGHSTITNLLAKWTEGKPGQWPKFLRAAFFVENVTVKRTTKYAPATLWYGRHATFPIKSFMKTWRREDLEVDLSFEELLDIRARQVGAAEERLREAAGQVERSRMEDKMRWDQMARVREEPLAVGDVVLLYHSSLEKQWSRKLDKRRLGPYRILRCGEFGAYQIEELDETGWQDWALAQREGPAEAAHAVELVQAVGPARAAELPPTYGLEQVEFRRITDSDLRGPSPTLPEGGEAVPLRTPLDRLEAHLDASQWGASQLGANQRGPEWYEPVEDEPEEEPPESGPEAGSREPKEPQTEGVFTVGDDTPPPTPITEQARQYWHEEIPKSDGEEMLGPPPEATTPPPTQAEPEGGEKARTPTTVAPQLTESTGARMDLEVPTSGEPWPGPPPAEEGTSERDPLREGHEARTGKPPGETKEEKRARVQVRLEELYQEKLRMEAAGEAPKPPIDPPTSEQRISEAWASYESERDAARLRSREVGQGRAGLDEARKIEDLGFSATRMEIERIDRRIGEVEVSSFQRYSMLSDELAALRLEVGQLSTQLVEERVENQAWRSRMEVKEAKWEKRLQDMAAIVERLSVTKVVDWTEQSRYGIQGEEVQGLFGREGTTEPPQQGGKGKVFLDPIEAAARREAEEGRFNFRIPTELASQQATPMTIEVLEGGAGTPTSSGGRGPTEESPTILLEVQEGALTGATASTEPEAMGGEASRLDELVAAMELDMPLGEPQRQKTPERVPEIGELRTQLGSWATGADSGEHISDQQQEVMSEPATAVTPQPSDLHRDEGATTMGGVREGRPLRLDTSAY
ncbi:hypothetical protein CBR_g22120 [Chara braunii]|uniref:Integrase catalytic domain-containing protein n=1 Tax=Chara braunii TaxID=69332 RepID=A0A388L2E4_CHABU|nr:hypothetical protein CBR_g22120 [Chara braunii]|eukprot:GBG76373.1 hypothetical protein CBR_g22120 [Chara braunii]